MAWETPGVTQGDAGQHQAGLPVGQAVCPSAEHPCWGLLTEEEVFSAICWRPLAYV